jgi:hypothetical protein
MAKKTSSKTKRPVAKKAQSTRTAPRATFTVGSHTTSEQTKMVRKFLGLQNILNGNLGCVQPIYNPYELISFKDGYHGRCIRAKVAAVVGQGYEASDVLRMHINNINGGDYSFQELLNRATRDYFTQGWFAVNVVSGDNTGLIWHSPAIKTRVKVNPKTKAESVVRFEYEPNLDYMSYVEEPFFKDHTTDANGVRMFGRYGDRAQKYYGEPEYIEVLDVLRMNWSIVYAAMRWFDNGLMADYAIIEKGMGREDEAEIEALKDYMTDHMKGISNAHKVIYMQVAPDEDVTFEKLSSDFPGKDSTELRQVNRDEIIVAHGLFPRLIGVATAGALGGINEVQAQFGAFKQLTSDPEQRTLEAFWQNLFNDMGFADAESFKLKPLNITSPLETIQTLSTGTQTGIISVDEARRDWNTEKRIAPEFIESLKEIRKELMR